MKLYEFSLLQDTRSPVDFLNGIPPFENLSHEIRLMVSFFLEISTTSFEFTVKEPYIVAFSAISLALLCYGVYLPNSYDDFSYSLECIKLLWKFATKAEYHQKSISLIQERYPAEVHILSCVDHAEIESKLLY